MCQIKINNLIHIFLFLKYDDIKLKYNYSMYVGHSIRHASDAEYSTVDCAADRIKKFRSNNEVNRIDVAVFDRTECTSLILS